MPHTQHECSTSGFLGGLPLLQLWGSRAANSLGIDAHGSVSILPQSGLLPARLTGVFCQELGDVLKCASRSIGCRALPNEAAYTGGRSAAEGAEDSRIDLTSDCEAPAAQAASGRVSVPSPSSRPAAPEAEANGHSCLPAQWGCSPNKSQEVCKVARMVKMQVERALSKTNTAA